MRGHGKQLKLVLQNTLRDPLKSTYNKQKIFVLCSNLVLNQIYRFETHETITHQIVINCMINDQTYRLYASWLCVTFTFKNSWKNKT